MIESSVRVKPYAVTCMILWFNLASDYGSASPYILAPCCDDNKFAAC